MDQSELNQHLERFENAVSRITRYLAARSGGETGLSPSQRIVLRALKDGPLQVSEVAARLGVTLSAATGLVDRMARSDLVGRERDRADRRVVWVKLTAEGTRTLQVAERYRLELLREMLAPLGEADLSRLCGLLEALKSE